MNTTQNLPAILTARNSRRYARLIQKATAGDYHDTLSQSPAPKRELEQDLSRFPELRDVLDDVKNGHFNERDGGFTFSNMWLLLNNLRYVNMPAGYA